VIQAADASPAVQEIKETMEGKRASLHTRYLEDREFLKLAFQDSIRNLPVPEYEAKLKEYQEADRKLAADYDYTEKLLDDEERERVATAYTETALAKFDRRGWGLAMIAVERECEAANDPKRRKELHGLVSHYHDRLQEEWERRGVPEKTVLCESCRHRCTPFDCYERKPKPGVNRTRFPWTLV